MALLDTTYDVSELPQSSGYDVLPAGWYSASISEATLNTTRNGTGQYIKVRYDITGPSHQGRVVWGNLNIRNQNPKAEDIGRQQFGELMRAIGLSRVKDTDQLIGGQLQIKLTIRPAEGQYEAQNDVKGFKAISGSEKPQAPTPFPPQQKTGASKAPWKKG